MYGTISIIFETTIFFLFETFAMVVFKSQTLNILASNFVRSYHYVKHIYVNIPGVFKNKAAFEALGLINVIF